MSNRSLLRFSKIVPSAIAATFALSLPSAAQQFVLQPGAIPGTKRWTEGVECADVDQDGDLDIFFAEGEGFTSAGAKRQNILIINKLEVGPGQLADESVARLGVHTANAKSVDTGDVDGDGWIDAMFANAFNNAPPSLYINKGAAQPGFFTFEGMARGFTSNYSSGCSNFADLDNDGDLDVIISDSGNSYLGGSGGKPHLFFNDGTGNFTENAAALGAPVKKAHMDVQYADIDGDWDLDFLGFNRSANTNGTHYLMLNDGVGNFSDASTLYPSTSSNVYEAEVGDLDGDTDIDMFFVSLSGFAEGPISNNMVPTGTLGFTKGSSLSSGDDNEIALLDYDNDGDFDAVVGSLTNTEKMMKNDGSGAFTVANGTFTAKGDSTLDATVADLNNDGAYEVITAQGESGTANWDNKLYLNTGSADTLAPIIVREEDVASGASGPWIVRSEIRDQVMDDGKNWVTADLDYVVRTGPMTAAVTTQGLTFSPAVLTVAAGTTVTWTNTGASGIQHTVTSSTPGYAFDSGLFNPGETFSYTFVRPGTYDYFCIPHVGFGMTGQVIVTAGTSQKGEVLDMGGGGMVRFEMADTSGGTGVDLVYERRFTDWPGNFTVSEVQVVSLGGSSGSFTVYGTGSSAANYMAIAGTGSTQINNAFQVVTTGVTQVGVFVVASLNQTNTPLFGGTMLADFFNQLIPLTFAPAAGGTATMPGFIPNDPTLVGLPVFFQSGITDATQPGGFGMSDGLQLIIGA